MSLRVQQAVIMGIGLIAAVIMGTLGLWQAQRSTEVGHSQIAARAETAPVPLLEWINPDGTVKDIYGKPATVTGHYLPEQQLLVRGEDGTVRVLTALQVADGRVVPIVRGTVTGTPPPPPAGESTATGIFLPGEGETHHATGPGELGSVRTPQVAQYWPQRVTPGFITLDAAGAAAQGLAPASVTLPEGDQALQNGSYAIQWWIFAAFALLMSAKLAADAGKRDRDAKEKAALEAATVASGPAAPKNEAREDN